jgi:hypothetical protein
MYNMYSSRYGPLLSPSYEQYCFNQGSVWRILVYRELYDSCSEQCKAFFTPFPIYIRLAEPIVSLHARVFGSWLSKISLLRLELENDMTCRPRPFCGTKPPMVNVCIVVARELFVTGEKYHDLEYQ